MASSLSAKRKAEEVVWTHRPIIHWSSPSCTNLTVASLLLRHRVIESRQLPPHWLGSPPPPPLCCAPGKLSLQRSHVCAQHSSRVDWYIYFYQLDWYQWSSARYRLSFRTVGQLSVRQVGRMFGTQEWSGSFSPTLPAERPLTVCVLSFLKSSKKSQDHTSFSPLKEPHSASPQTTIVIQRRWQTLNFTSRDGRDRFSSFNWWLPVGKFLHDLSFSLLLLVCERVMDRRIKFDNWQLLLGRYWSKTVLDYSTAQWTCHKTKQNSGETIWGQYFKMVKFPWK